MIKSIVRKIIALIEIVILMMANFVLIFSNTITYALEDIDQDASTNNKNVEFIAYFKTENEKKTYNKQEKLNNEDIKLFFLISVKNEGYLNSKIFLEDANFKIKNDIRSEYVSKIEDNQITLNQINAGQSIEIEVGIEPVYNQSFELKLLDMKSKLVLNGSYTNSQGSDIDIKATKAVNLILASPYTDENAVELKNEVITNKIYNIDGEQRRVVQLLVETRLKENVYPIKQNYIKVIAENTEDILNVQVETRGTKATNGKTREDFTDENWNYNKAKELEINILNQEEKGIVSWNKNTKDVFIVTYIYKDTDEITNENFKIENLMSLWDNKTQIKKVAEVNMAEEKDGIVQYTMENAQESLYKGKIYSKENKEYTRTSRIDINYMTQHNYISLVAGKDTYVGENGYTIEAKSIYKNITISKEDINNILGKSGKLLVKTLEGEKITEYNSQMGISEDLSLDIEKGNLEGIIIELQEIEQTGSINIKATKILQDNNIEREDIQKINRLRQNIKLETNTDVKNVEKDIKLEETYTKASIATSKSNLSAISVNEDIEMRITLETKEENDLYKNPKFRLYMPYEVNYINLKSLNLLYSEELNITKANVIEENGIKFI